MKQIILTGDRPTGNLHVGHYVGSLAERVKLQNSGKYDEIYIMIADAQALTDNADNPEKVRQNILQVALDYLACGLDPNKVHIFIQSMVPQLTELSFYYQNLVTVSRLQRNPTVKSEIQMRNFEASIPVGFFCYPISQAADITAFKATTVPAGEDQKPMIEQCCEIVHKFNSVYGETLVEPEIVLPQNAACLRLPGIDGKAKMSKSLGNCIYLSEEPEDIEKKVKSMFTDPNHLRVQDPGKVEGNPVFIYLDAFCRPEHFAEFWPEYQNLDEVKAHYQRGGLGDMKVKKFLNSVMQAELEPIRTRRKEWEQRLPEVVEILKEGSAYAEKTAAATLDEVMKQYHIPGIYGIDTRKLVRKIRDFGSCKALLTDAQTSPEEGLKKLAGFEIPKDAVEKVSSKEIRYCAAKQENYLVAAIDCGIKENIIRSLNARGCSVMVYPWNTSYEEIQKQNPDGVFLSNGPGNPKDVKPVLELVRKIRGNFPLFGICLGHQMIGLAYGAGTYKLKFGHRGGNHPVKNLKTGKIEITSQNHSYAVDYASLKNTDLEMTHINLLDHTVEGIACRKDHVFSVQYHPESAPGPQDSGYLFDQFIQMMEENKHGKAN